MINSITQRLLVLENFVIDRDLPKFAKNTNVNTFNFVSNVISQSSGWQMAASFSEDEIGSEQIFFKRKSKKGFFRKLKGLFQKKPKPISVLKFFENVKLSGKEICSANELALGYDNMLSQARKSGQKALEEKILQHIEAYKSEINMKVIGIDKFIDEKSIVELYLKFKKINNGKSLKLSYIKNYTRNIPQHLIDLKVKADELEIFDNYAILHYDPDNKSTSDTKSEIEAKKDPILFGLIDGINKLYVVGDWIDELCDLTIEKIAETIGASHIKNTADLELIING